MKFGYTIVYVPDVAASLAFFERAFGFPRRFLHESQTYGELDTGDTTLSFAAHRPSARSPDPNRGVTVRNARARTPVRTRTVKIFSSLKS